MNEFCISVKLIFLREVQNRCKDLSAQMTLKKWGLNVSLIWCFISNKTCVCTATLISYATLIFKIVMWSGWSSMRVTARTKKILGNWGLDMDKPSETRNNEFLISSLPQPCADWTAPLWNEMKTVIVDVVCLDSRLSLSHHFPHYSPG